MKRISEHTAYLGERLYTGLSRLRHSNGNPVVRICTDHNVRYGDAATTGATIALHVLEKLAQSFPTNPLRDLPTRKASISVVVHCEIQEELPLILN